MNAPARRHAGSDDSPGPARASCPGNTAPGSLLFLNPDSIGTACGLSAGDLALLAGLPADAAESEPWHPQLQALLCTLVDLFARLKAADPEASGVAFWAAHRAVRALGGRTLVEAVADGDGAAVDAYLGSADTATAQPAHARRA